MPGTERFPRTERLTRKSEFQRIYRTGERRVCEAFTCYAVRRPGQGRKMGCTVSRKVGSAVARNRVKRLIREVYRKHRWHLASDVHLVIVARPRAAALSYDQCDEAIRRLFHNGGLLLG